MARKKVNLAWIEKDSARKATYKKRKRGLLKKVSELSTLCGIRACAIVYGPSETMPETWPPATAAVEQIIHAFNDLSQVEKSKKMLSQEGFMTQRVNKLKEQLSKLRKENQEAELKNTLIRAMHDRSALNVVGIEEIQTLMHLVDSKLAKVRAANEPPMSSYGLPPPLLPFMAVPPPMALMPTFPAMQMREEELLKTLHRDAPIGMDHVFKEETNYMTDFLVNLESYPTAWSGGDNNFNWIYSAPQM